jgi:hypothetical protein
MSQPNVNMRGTRCQLMEQVRLAIEIILRKRVVFEALRITSTEIETVEGRIRAGDERHDFIAYDRHDRDMTELEFRDEMFTVRSPSVDEVAVSHSENGRLAWLVGTSFSDVRIEPAPSRR